MAEVLAELVAKITADATELKKALSESEKDIKGLGKTTDKETKSIKDSFLAIGKVATVVGVAITAAMTKMVMSFTKVGSELYDLSLKTGVSVEALAGLKYAAEQNGATLGTIEMAIRGVAIAMSGLKENTDEQVKAFGKVGLSLKDLQGLNPEEQFIRLANAVAQVSDPFDKLTIATTFFGRSGRDMLPMLSEGADGLKRYMEQGVKASSWTTEMATLADKLGDSFGTLGTTMGGLTNTIVSSLAPALKDLSDELTGIVGKITEWVKLNPSLTKAITLATGLMGVLSAVIGLAAIAVKVFGAAAMITFGGWILLAGLIVAAIVLIIDIFNKAGIASKKLNDENKAVFDKMSKDIEAFYAKKRTLAEDATNKAILAIQKEYGVSKDLSKSLIDQAYEVRDARLKAIDDEERKATDAYNKRLSQIEDEYRLSLSKEERALQDQIDAIDAQTEAEDIAARIRELKDRISQSTGEERLRAEADLARYLLLQTREAEKDALRAKIQELRDGTSEIALALQSQRDAAIEAANAALKATLDNWAIEKAAAEIKLADTIKGYETDRDAKIKAEGVKLENVLKNIAKEEAALKTSLADRLAEATTYQLNLESILHDITQTITTNYVTTYSGSGGGGGGGGGGAPPGWGPGPWEPGFTPAAHGGIVTQPTLALVGEAGAEAIIPLNEGLGGITINFTQPVFFDREDTMNRFIDKISRSLDRKYRLGGRSLV